MNTRPALSPMAANHREPGLRSATVGSSAADPAQRAEELNTALLALARTLGRQAAAEYLRTYASFSIPPAKEIGS